MQLLSIKGIHFKNYESFDLKFDTNLNGIVGWNGMGKTNLLDAIHYLCMGKSYFSGLDKNLVRKSEENIDFFRLEGIFQRMEKVESVVVKVQLSKRKEIEYNKVKHQKLSEHIGIFPVVVIAPFDVAIALDGSELRRNFVDNMLSQLNSNYLNTLIQYNKIIEQRNSALKQFAEKQQTDYTLLDIYDQQLIPLGTSIFEQRQMFLTQFLAIFQQLYATITGNRELANYEYITQLSESSFAKLLQDNRAKDQILQRTTVGIHKDDLHFYINELPVKQFASQGQLKSFVLALKLAQAKITKQEKGFPPLLLLDDIFDRLDKQRVKQLIALLLEDHFGQIFITDTDSARTQELLQIFNQPYTLFHIESGKVF